MFSNPRHGRLARLLLGVWLLWKYWRWAIWRRWGGTRGPPLWTHSWARSWVRCSWEGPTPRLVWVFIGVRSTRELKIGRKGHARLAESRVCSGKLSWGWLTVILSARLTRCRGRFRVNFGLPRSVTRHPELLQNSECLLLVNCQPCHAGLQGLSWRLSGAVDHEPVGSK